MLVLVGSLVLGEAEAALQNSIVVGHHLRNQSVGMDRCFLDLQRRSGDPDVTWHSNGPV